MVRIDAASDAATEFGIARGKPRSVWFANGRPLVTIRAVPTAHRGGTLRVVSGRLWFPISLDPAEDFDATGGLTLLTNDGLLGYQRVGGAEGTTLVPPAWRSRCPTCPMTACRTCSGSGPGSPSRPGCRSARATSCGPSSERLSIYARRRPGVRRDRRGRGVRGPGSRGSRQRRRCGRGRRHRHVPSRPARPVVPACPRERFGPGRPGGHAVGEQTTPLPATGPYMFKRFDDDGISLVRNPRFETLVHRRTARGFPDEIVWSPVPDESDPSELVEAGEADLVVGGLSRDRVQRLAEGTTRPRSTRTRGRRSSSRS